MRAVARTITRTFQPRPPWTWRAIHSAGAPRTCLSHYRDPVFITLGGRRLQTGWRDWLLRLYQHHGATEHSAVHDGMVLYDPVDEWPLVKEHIDWLEYVDNRREMVFRMHKKEALMLKRELETAYGLRFGVPLDAYQAYERD